MLRAPLALAALCALAVPLAAQAPKSIDPGMSQAKVVERLGDPDASRTSGDFKYLFYHNSCIRTCGMDDVVILQKDSVVDAMFRSTDRSYTGKSSSPRAIPAEVAARTRPGARDIPSGEVVQAGNARSDTAASASKPDSAATPAREKPAAKKSTKKAHAANADSTHRDTISGTLHIPVKPPIHTSAKPDSAHADSTPKRPPHEE
jgi:hypothetical protein